MPDSNTATIYAAAGFYDLPLPQRVVEAKALVDAATQQHDEIAALTPPDLTQVTVKTLPAAFDAALAFETRDVRLRVAAELLGRAQSALDQVMFASAGELWAPLADRFADAGQRFTKALADLGGVVNVAACAVDPAQAEAFSRLRTAAADLDYLRGARDAFAHSNGLAVTRSNIFEEVSRCLVINDNTKLHRNPLRGRDVEFWQEAVERGYQIRWQTREEQVQNGDAALAYSRAHAA